MKIEVLTKDEKSMQLLIQGVEIPFINALRRAILTEVPCMAIDEVMMLENSSTISTSKQHALFVLTSDLPNIFQIPDQYFYNNFDYELDVTQLVREWIEGTAVNYGFVAAGPLKNFQDNNQNYVIAYRPELEIWYLEKK